MPYCPDVVGEPAPGLALRAFLGVDAARPRTRCRAALDGVGAAGVAGRDRLLDDGLAQVVAHLPVRLRAVALGTLLSVCDGGRPEFRLVRGLLQKDDDEDVEDADHGLFRHLAGSAAVLAASNSSRAARRHHPASPRASPGARPAASSGTPPCASSAHRFPDAFPHTDHAEPRKQLAQPARRLRSKVAHWRSPSFSMTTTKRIGLQCQISTKTRSLLYPDIKPEPGGEQLLLFKSDWSS